MRSCRETEKQEKSRKPKSTFGTAAVLSIRLAIVLGLGLFAVTAELHDKTLVVCAEQPETFGETSAVTEALTKEQTDRIVGFMIEKIASGALTDEEAVREAIAEGEEKFQVTLTEEDKENIIKLVNTVTSWDFDAEELAEKAKDLYDKYGTDLLQDPEQALKEAAEDGVKGFFKGVGDFCVNVGKEVASFFKKGAEKLFHLF